MRRRETVSMTPSNALVALRAFANASTLNSTAPDVTAHKDNVSTLLKDITNTSITPLVASSGLSIQYAIMMGLVNEAQDKHPNKPIKFIVPQN